jgi:N4-gp56 family major capsid protein
VADNLTTTTDIDPAVAIFYDRVLLERATPELIHDRFAQKRPMPAKSGNTIKFRRYASLSLATTPLAEGVTPPGQKLSKTDILATVSQFGDYVHVTDWVDLTVEDAVLTEANELLGEQSGQTWDALVRNALVACASQVNCSGGGNGQTPTQVSATDLDAATKTLMGANAKMIAEVVTAGTGVGTSPMRPAYWGMAHTDLIDAFEAITGWKNTAEYAQQGPVAEGEWGGYKNSRWLVSTVCDRTLGTPDIYRCPLFAQNAYGVIDISSGNMKSIVKAFGSGGTADPLNQRATAGWKFTFAARILNDSFMLLLRCTNKAGS